MKEKKRRNDLKVEKRVALFKWIDRKEKKELCSKQKKKKCERAKECNSSDLKHLHNFSWHTN